jgi:hypothetical protein
MVTIGTWTDFYSSAHFGRRRWRIPLEDDLEIAEPYPELPTFLDRREVQ